MADFLIENHFTLYLVRPLNKVARRHLEDHTSDEAQWFGDALVVEHRYVAGIVDQLQAHGFTLEF